MVMRILTRIFLSTTMTMVLKRSVKNLSEGLDFLGRLSVVVIGRVTARSVHVIRLEGDEVVLLRAPERRDGRGDCRGGGS